MAEYSNSNNLIIGLGGIGGRVLRELRKRMFDEGLLRTDGHHQLPIAFMYIDSTDELMHHNDPSWMTLDGHNAQFSHSEFLNIQIAGAPAAFPQLKEIIGKSKVIETYRPGCGAMQNRRLGRVMFAANAQRFYNMLQEKDHELSMITGHDDLEKIYIVTGLAGGTGSGSVVDVIAQAHKRYPHAVIFVMVALPTIPPRYGHDQGHYLANVYAALKELNALNVDAFRPLDMMTSGQRVDTNNQEKLQFTLIPFENGSIADCLHSFLTIINPQGDEYANCIYREISRYAPEVLGHCLQWEYSAKEPEKKKPVRTLTLASYAQKIIVHPKDLILRRISYSMQAQFMRQILHNNYHEIIGFVDETKPLDYKDILSKRLHVWNIDNKSLTLQWPFSFISHDSSINSIQLEWERMADICFHNAAELESGWEMRFNYLREAYEDNYHTRYRHYGVEEYFGNKVSAANDYAQAICHEIQHDLFMHWYQGEFGIIDLIEIVKRIIDYLRDENENTFKRIEVYKEQSVEYREEMGYVREDFDHLNIILRAMRAEHHLQRYNKCLREYYISLTHIHAIEFEKQLLVKLINRLFEIEDRLMAISSKLEKMEEEAIHIAEKIEEKSKGHHNTHSPIVDLSNEDAIQCCIDKLVADKDVMKRLSTLLRQKIAEHYDDFRQLEYHLDGKELDYCANITKRDIESYFLSLGETIVNQEKIMRLIDDLTTPLLIKYRDSNIDFVFSMMRANERNAYMESKEEIVRQFTYNNPFYENTLTALLHSNVTNREQIDHFVYECISGLGVPLQLNEAELMRVFPNNSYYPCNHPYPRNHMVFVGLPRPTTEEGERLYQEFKNAFKAASFNIQVSTVESRDEITIISLRTQFPIRAIYILPKLKAQYESYIAENTDKALGLLHTEDSCRDLPSLEVEDFSDSSSSSDIKQNGRLYLQ